jgi:hypothetical protein
MYNLTFHPYIGEKFEGSKKRILILGESHYCGEGNGCCFKNNTPSCFNFTSDVLSKRFIKYKEGNHYYERWMNTFTRFSNIYNGKKLNKQETIEFWKNISFYNYVQYPMGNARQSPSSEDFTRSYDAFKQIVHKLDPSFIVFWGDRMWRHFPKEDYRIEEVNSTIFNVLSLDKKIPFIVLPHPSSSKLSYKYKEVIEDFVNKCETYA